MEKTLVIVTHTKEKKKTNLCCHNFSVSFRRSEEKKKISLKEIL